MTRTIDLHAHVIVPEILRDAAPGEAWRPKVWRDGDARVVEMAGREVRAGVREWVDVDQILADPDAAGTDRVVLSPSKDDALPGFRAKALSHGAFDNEPSVIESVTTMVRDW